MADVQLTIVDQENTQIALAAPAETAVNVAVPGIQGPTGATGDVAVAQDGTAALPGIRFQSDTNTGIYRPGADQLAISTGGVERVRITSDGKVGIGTSNPVTKFQVGTGAVTADTSIARFGTEDANVYALVLSNWTGTTTSYAPKIAFDNSTRSTWVIGGEDGGGAFIFKDATAGSNERMRIDSSGRLLVGTSTAQNKLTVESSINGDGATLSYSGVAGTGRSSLAFSAANNTPAQITIARVSGMLTSGSVGTEAGELYLETKQTSDAVPQVRVTVKASGIVNISNAPTYADNAAATTAGLAVGDVYRTATGQLMIRY